MANIKIISKNQRDDHAIRFLLAEKNQKFNAYPPENEYIKTLTGEWLATHTRFPIVIDNGICLDNLAIILEYIDERYPHPPVMPIDPGTRAQSRLLIQRIHEKWNELLNNEKENENAIHQELNTLNIILQDQKYLLGNCFSIADIFLMPTLYRLRQTIRNTIAPLNNLNNYTKLIGNRKSFQISLASYEADTTNPIPLKILQSA